MDKGTVNNGEEIKSCLTKWIEANEQIITLNRDLTAALEIRIAAENELAESFLAYNGKGGDICVIIEGQAYRVYVRPRIEAKSDVLIAEINVIG